MSNVGLKSKHCDFTFALSNLDQCNDVKDIIPDFDVWAYIKHLPDSENGSEHFHFYIHLKQPITIQNLSKKLGVPEFMIEWCRMKTRVIQYLIHKNNPEKHQYLPSQIITNNREYINRFLNPEENHVNVFDEYKDLEKVSNGYLPISKYIEKHNDSISSLSFYSRSNFLIRLINLKEMSDYD